MDTYTLSLAAAVAVTGISRRTLWRRIEQGAVRKAEPGANSGVRLFLEDVLPFVPVPMDSEDLEFLTRADGGEAEAQADMGQKFYVAEKFESAIYWLELAVNQNHPDAMHWLSQCYLSGSGVAKDSNLALVWLAKAAANGHQIAQSQLDALLKSALHAP